MFDELHLEEFAGVNDAGEFRADLEPADLVGSGWACGFYVFARE
jgi:hypothetical protein